MTNLVKLSNDELADLFAVVLRTLPKGVDSIRLRDELLRRLGAAVSPQPDLHVDLVYVFDALIACSEALACTCKPGSEDGPCPSCQANHSAAIIERMQKRAAVSASPQPSFTLEKIQCGLWNILGNVGFNLQHKHVGKVNEAAKQLFDYLTVAAAPAQEPYRCDDCGCKFSAVVTSLPTKPEPHFVLSTDSENAVLYCPHCGGTMIFPESSQEQPVESSTRFHEFDDEAHPFNKWWQKHGQFMMAGGGRLQFIWACRGWIAHEQFIEGAEVTGESICESLPASPGPRPVCPKCGSYVQLELLYPEAKGIVATCAKDHRFPLMKGLEDCAQFFPASPNGEKQRQIDISNLRFYSAMAHDFRWQTDIIHYGVITQTLQAIADRLAGVAATTQGTPEGK